MIKCKGLNTKLLHNRQNKTKHEDTEKPQRAPGRTAHYHTYWTSLTTPRPRGVNYRRPKSLCKNPEIYMYTKWQNKNESDIVKSKSGLCILQGIYLKLKSVNKLPDKSMIKTNPT